MGTRHLIAVKQGQLLKVAQYGQWDGYPDSAGIAVLNFLRTADMAKFDRHVEQCTFLRDDEIRLMNIRLNTGMKCPPEFHRDTGSDILKLIEEKPRQLVDSHKFAAASLFCEYAYVIDLDAQTLEFYEGFQELSEGPAVGRFKDVQPAPNEVTGNGYGPVTLTHTFDLNNLPSDDKFLETVEPAEEEEDEPV